ncbi:sensor histidine kinase [Paenibacillus sp. L3-i20]|uniref:sensor histidine kinase n=1 Tax=Paenibacillus sp. L3-i20 TaxID=2905833 RepID=UPI001EE0011C|nr:sensor histidine kinase [Paenibacillus sp. L3-i20]GKU77393.1 sensor histidine kinase [Paenibacillus sp. L3-i20]
MLKGIYPVDQIEKYLLIDVLFTGLLIYLIVVEEDQLSIGIKLVLILFYLLALYVGLWYKDWRQLMATLTGSLVLVVLGIYLGEWILMYGFVFADLLGRANRRATIAAGMCGIVAMFFLYSWMDTGNPFAFISTLIFPFMIAQLATPIVVYTRGRAHLLKEKLDIANAQLERFIQEEERNRIARDLHDTLGQTLTMIKLKSELTMRLVDKNPEKAKDELLDIVNNSRYALKQVRELVTDMKFVSFTKEMELSKEILRKAGIEMIVEGDRAIIPLSNVAETMAALSVREAVTNIIKHSEADQCTVAHYIQFEHYYIKVSDNGNGHIKQGDGNGLLSIKERMSKLQGDMYISAEPDKGTVITLKVPLASIGRV